MRKGTIFKYEFKRILFSKEYLLLLIAALAYSVSLLRSMVIFGTNYTAPFSQWTFSTYCTSLAPFLFVLLLVLCARQFKASERGAEAIINAAPMPIRSFRLLRFGTIACAYFIPVILSVAVCLAFYGLVFDYTSFGPLIRTGFMLLLPPSILLFGTATYFGGKKPILVYIMLAAVLVTSVFHIGLPSWIDLTGGSVTEILREGTQEFSFLPSFITGRAVFLILGLILTIVSLKSARLQSSKD